MVTPKGLLQTTFLFDQGLPIFFKRACYPEKKTGGSLLWSNHTKTSSTKSYLKKTTNFPSKSLGFDKAYQPNMILHVPIKNQLNSHGCIGNYTIPMDPLVRFFPPPPFHGVFRLWTFDKKWATCTRSTMCSWPSKKKRAALHIRRPGRNNQGDSRAFCVFQIGGEMNEIYTV